MPPGTPSRQGRSAVAESSYTPTTATTPSRRRVIAGVGGSSTVLSPSLPRPPSWQSSIAASNNDKILNRRRSKRSSKDERDPDEADSSQEDNDELNDKSDMFAPSNNSIQHATTANNRRARSRSLVATPSASAAATAARPGSRAGTNDEKQNICVCVRVRPSAANAPENDSPIWHLDQTSGRITLAEAHPIMEKRKTTATSESYDYHFDSLLLPPNPTQSLYNERLSETIKGVMEGYNGTIFSYGQTGSGKTHTMMGNDEEHGIIPLAIQEIFALIRADPKRTFLLQLSYLEIYKESLRDLLNPNTPSAKLQLVEDDKIKGKIKCTNLTWEVVTDPVQVYNIIMRGEASRSVAGTDWNERSSRSHTVISMIVESHSLADVPLESPATELPYATSLSPPKKTIVNVRSSQLNLIDLAGSERAVSSEDRRSEGSAINKSLLYLGNVIEKLADGKARNGAHINYRDSKLTRLLQTSLSGNARIAIVCTISPEARHGIESVSTLKFASRAAKVITKAERGDVADADVAKIADLSEQVARLTRELEENQRLEKDVVIDETELISERSKRQQAESQAENYRLETLRLQEEIQKLSSQMVTATSASQPIPYVPSTPRDERDYGDLSFGPGQTPGDGPTGPRGRRRISELSFIGTPISRAKQVASMRSFSSNLDIIKSPSLVADIDKIDSRKVKELEKEVQDLKSRLEQDEGKNSTIKDLQEHIETLQQELIYVHEQTKLAVSEKDSYIQEAGKQASQIMILQRDLSQASSNLSTSESELGVQVAQLEAEISTLRFQIAESESQLTIYKESQNTSKAEEVQKLMDVTRELEEVQAEMEEVKRMSANKDQALSSQRKQLENFKTELEDAMQTQKDLEEAEKRIEQLRNEVQTKERITAEEKAKLKEKHAQELKLQIQKNEAAIEKQESLQQELITLHGLLSSKGNQEKDNQSELQQLREALKQRDATIAKQKRDLEQKDATIDEQRQQLQTSADAADNARAQACSLQSELDQSRQEITALRQKAITASQQAEERFLRLTQDSAAKIEHSQAELGDLHTTNRRQADSLARMQTELDKQEAARLRLKASKAPPDFSSLKAKLQAVQTSAGLPTSLSRSTSSASSDQDDEGKVVKMVEALRKELAQANDALEASRATISGKDDHIEQLEQEIQRLDAKVEELRQDLTKYWGYIQIQSTALKKLTPDDGSQAGVEEEIAFQEKAVRPLPIAPRTSTPDPPPSPEKRSRAPFANLGHHRASNSVSSYRASSRPSTPIKRGTNSHLGTPEPLPTPPDMWEERNLRKSRRTTIDKELENVRLSQRAERSKSILLSPKAEKPKEWKNEHSRSRTLSSVNDLEQYRYKKSSA